MPRRELTREEQVACLNDSVEKWNVWRGVNPEIRPDLSGADLDNAHLSDADLYNADLSHANLYNADLRLTNLGHADLSHADLYNADLSHANLRDSVLCNADLRHANLSGFDLRNADLRDAILQETIFASVDLSATLNLDSCKHHGPSILDHRTLQRSGNLPLVFLRGCGLPDDWIEYLPSLTGRAIEFDTCFISYSTKDQEFADRIHKDLQDNGVRCWFAQHDRKGGKKLHEQIDRAIRVYDRLLLILSPHSMNSEWVKTEIAKARKREVEQGTQVLFPISLVGFEAIKKWECFDADTGKDSAREIREYFIPDFSDWETHDAYRNSFGRLLRDLKRQDVTPAE